MWNWWLPEDSYTAHLHPEDAAKGLVRQNETWLVHDLETISSAGWDSCIVCGSNSFLCNEEKYLHEFIRYEDFVEWDDQHKVLFYVNKRANVELPTTNFYHTQQHDGSQTMPLDCRSCQWYNSPKCILMRNAIEDLDNIIFNVDNIYEYQKGYEIVPCVNWDLAERAGFATTKDALKFIEEMGIYYGIDISAKINLNDDVLGTHFFDANYRYTNRNVPVTLRRTKQKA